MWEDQTLELQSSMPVGRSDIQIKSNWTPEYRVGDFEDYEFKVTLDGDSFAATARHRTSPETEPAFRVGPDGEVEELE